MEKGATRICILGAAFGTANMGVDVLAAGAIRCALNAYPDARITQVDYGRSSYEFNYVHNGRPVPVSFVGMRFSKKVLLRNNITTLLLLAFLMRVVRFESFRRWSKSVARPLSEMAEADLVLSLAGGDSFSDIYGARRLLYVCLPQLLALLLGRPLILMPQTFGPFKTPVARLLARRILRSASKVFARDAKSRQTALDLIGTDGGKTVVLAHDLGFDVPAQTSSNPQFGTAGADPSSPVIGVNVNGLLMMGGYNRRNMFGLQSDYPTLMRRLITMFLESGARVILIPHVLGDSDESDGPYCERICSELRSQYSGCISVLADTNYAETKYVIGRCDFFVGARMHSCIAALSQCVPTAAIAYSDKFIGVLDTIGCGDLVFDPRLASEQMILAGVRTAFQTQGELRSRLQQAMPGVLERVRTILYASRGNAVTGSEGPRAVAASAF
ncbi:MAG: hypothetical protein JWN34_6240 [Bryobacterales bacterium]|nr:hypothetical protein [Bryobacterales bacterium]